MTFPAHKPRPPKADPDQFEADFWFAHSRGILTLQEIATAFAISPNQVRALHEAGLIVAAGIGDDVHAERVHLRFERWSVVAWRLHTLSKQGVEMPIKETPQVSWWRKELAKRDGTLRTQQT